MAQRESVEEEEDVEHFEDVREEDEIVPNKEAETKENDVEVDQDNGRITSRDSSSDDEGALADRQSDEEDDYDSDDAEELFRKETPHEVTKEVSNDMEKRSQPPLKSSCLPGGYDPRHREPSYWSVYLIFLLSKLKYTVFVLVKSNKLCSEQQYLHMHL